MAIGTPVSLGTAATKNSTTEVITTGTSTASTDAILVAVFINSAADATVADSGGVNVYTRISSNTILPLAVFACYNSNGLASGATITATGTSGLTLNAASAWKVPGLTSSSQLVGYVDASGASTSPTATVSGLTSASYTAFGILGTQGPSGDTFTQATGGGTWATPPVRVGTTGNPANSNGTIAGGYLSSTATSYTYAPTITSRSWYEILLVFSSNVPTPPTNTGNFFFLFS